MKKLELDKEQVTLIQKLIQECQFLVERDADGASPREYWGDSTARMNEILVSLSNTNLPNELKLTNNNA